MTHLHREQGQFFGRSATIRVLNGIVVSETLYPAKLIIPRHDHALACISVVLEGHYLKNYGAQTRECKPGMVILHPAGEHHSDVHEDRQIKLLSIEILDQRLAGLRETAPLLQTPAALLGGETTALVQRLDRECRLQDSVSNLAIEAIVLELLVAGERATRRRTDRIPPPWLARAEAFLHVHFAETVSLEQLALVAGVHPAHLARTFRKHQRCTIGTYVRRLRFNQAVSQLNDHPQALAAIATACGFTDQSHFTRIFRAATGMTPAQYRRSLRSPR